MHFHPVGAEQLRFSVQNRAAINVERLPGDVSRTRRCQEHDHRGDVVRIIFNLLYDNVRCRDRHQAR
jgi:hypothetical protein